MPNATSKLTRTLVLLGATLAAAGSATAPAKAPSPGPGVSAESGYPEPGGAPGPEAAPPAEVAPPASAGGDLELCVAETNRYRAKLGLAPLRRSAELERCAAEGARADHASGQPHGHFVSTSGCGISFAENEIPRWPLSYAGSVPDTIRKGLEDMWGEGPGGGHYENMRGDYTELGCGIHVEGDAVTVVQDYR